MIEFVEGMHKVGEAMSAIVSAQVTKEAQEKLATARSGQP